MGIFGNLKREGLEESQDRVGGFSPFNSDAYDATVKMAYAIESTGGAKGIVWSFQMADGREYRETTYVTNKKGENFWLSEDKKKMPLPGFNVADDICMMTTDKGLDEQADEEKMVNVYDYEQKKEIPKSVPVLVDLIGKPVTLGLIRQTVNKNIKQGNEYVPGPETKDENVIDKVFHTPTKLTVSEAKRGLTEGEFYTKWLEANQGKVRDKTDKSSGGQTGRPPASGGAAPAEGGTPRKSLFGG
jgi:hypothetical protein